MMVVFSNMDQRSSKSGPSFRTLTATIDQYKQNKL